MCELCVHYLVRVVHLCLFTFVALSLSVLLCVQQVFGNTHEFCVMLERTAAFKKKTDPTSRVQYTWDFSEVTGMRRQPIDGGRHEQVEITFLRAPRESQVVFAKKKVRLIALHELHVMNHDHTAQFTFTHCNTSQGKRCTYENIPTGSILAMRTITGAERDEADPYIGMQVKKEFQNHGWFTGCVVSRRFDVGEDECVWKVKYDDGDEEEMDRFVFARLCCLHH